MSAFPVTINVNARTPEAPYTYGPFAVGSAIYVINTTYDPNVSGNGFLLAYKSTDGGETWTEQDPGNRPAATPVSIANVGVIDIVNIDLAACQSSADPTQIYAVFTDPNTGIATVQVFDAGLDAWGAVLGARFIGGFQAAVYRASDNSLVVFCSPNSTPDFAHTIVSFAVFDIGAGTFGVPIDLGFLDYVNATVWDQKTCGAVLRSDGSISVFMQQATRSTRAGQPQVVQTLTPGSTNPFQVPFDCPSFDLIDVQGAGGGGAGSGPADGGGGGGAGESSQTNVPATPLANIAIVVGAGGAENTDGGDSDWDSGAITAGGGKAGAAPTGGAGGAGTNPGGKGGDGAGTSGGGGGGNGTIDGPGQGGNDGDGTNGGTGGLDGSGNSGGGKGGQVLNNLVNGNTGQRGGGGGASSNGGLNVGTGGQGADGSITLAYTPFTNSHPSRMWQQTIHADNSLGTFTEITEGTFPIDGGGGSRDFSNSTGLVPFDCKAGDGFVVVVFTWVTATGTTQILYGRAVNADVLAFTFQAVDIDNGASGIDPEPALSIKTNGDVVMCYVSAADLVTVNYLFRKDTGSGMGTAKTIGAFADAGCRLQTAFIVRTCGAFGTPTQAITFYEGAG
jgi:hypothetical protein